MKIIFKKSDLTNAVSIVMKAVPSRPSRTALSILECILIDAKTNEIKFSANDMELGIETKVKGEIIEKGQIAIEAKIFSNIVRKLPDNDITLTTDNNFSVTISCEKAVFTILGKSGEYFTYLPMVKKDKSIYLSQFSLKEIIRQTIFSISTSENNKIMTGELFEVKGNSLKVVSLDGYRISIRKIELKESFNDISVIVPGKTLNEIFKILNGSNDDEVKIYFTDNHIVFEFDDTVVVSRLIEGEYFKISQMLSSNYVTKLTLDKKEFFDSISRATLLERDSDIKPIIMTIEDGNLQLQINTKMGSMEDNISITKEGKNLMIGFNPKFLIDALKVIDDEEITIYLLNSKAPCFIKNDDESYIYLVLPVNFNVVSRN